MRTLFYVSAVGSIATTTSGSHSPPKDKELKYPQKAFIIPTHVTPTSTVSIEVYGYDRGSSGNTSSPAVSPVPD
ncbi:hypothetical protein RHS03_02824, partial [Rhizoctonia solani]